MKKIVLVGLIALLFGGCLMHKTTDVVIENKSNEVATVSVKNFKEGTKQILNQNFVISSGQKVILPFYDNGEANLESIGRNYLKKVSSARYEILNSNPIVVKVYNTIPKKIRISDINNLFDSVIVSESLEQDINVFNNPQKIQAVAVTVPDGIILQTQIQGNKIIIKY